MKKYILKIIKITGIFLFLLSSSLTNFVPKAEASAPQASPQIVSEVAQKRTETSKDFLNSDGSHTKVIYQNPIHYKDSQGKFEDIDRSFVSSQAPNYQYEVKTGIYTAKLKDTLQHTPNEGDIQLDYGGAAVGFSPMELFWSGGKLIGTVQNTKGVLSSDKTHITYSSLFGVAGVDLQGTYDNEKFLKETVIKNPQAIDLTNHKNEDLEIKFNLSLSSGVDLKVNGKIWDKKSPIETQDAIGILQNGQQISQFAQAIVYDSGQNVQPITIRLAKEGNSLTLTKIIPGSFLLQAQYPVRTDTTDVFYANNDGTVNSDSTASYAACRSGATLTASGNYVIFGQNKVDTSNNWNCREAFVQFDTSSIPDNAIISSAVFAGKWLTNYLGGDHTLFLLLRDYGSTLDTGDWVAGSSLSGLTLLGTRSNSGLVMGNYYDFSDTAMSANVNKTGATRMVLTTDEMSNGWAPYDWDYHDTRIYPSAEAGTDSDPKLTVTYTVPTAPTITSPTKTSITGTSATLGGNVTSDGGATITGRGVCVGTSANPALGGNCFSTSGTTGVFTVSATSLSNGTLYHYRAYATNSVGTSYTTDDTFTTLSPPTITTPTKTGVQGSQATLGGNVTSDGGSTITGRGVCVGTSANPALGGNCFSTSGTTGVFTVSATSLTQGTLYHYRAYATNATSTGYTTDDTFTTQLLNSYTFAVITPQIAGVCVTGTNTITAKDSSGATISDDTSTVNMSTSGLGLTFYTSSACSTPTTQYTLSSGVANIYYKTNKGQIMTITATKASSTETGTSAKITVYSATAHWKFDEGTGTTANDGSGNADTTTLGGTTIPTWQAENQCISGKCLYFDGSTSKVTGSKIAPGLQTVSFWIRPNTIASQGLVNLDGGTHKISTNGSGVITATGFSSPTYYINGLATTTPTLAANQWNFVEITTNTAFNSTSSFTIGTDGTNFIKGYFDEVKFYSYARSADQVKIDYNSRGALQPAEVLGAQSPRGDILSNGLVGYWKMDENTGTTTSDGSGNSNTGTIVGSIEATGGTITYSGGYTIHTFTTSGTFTPNSSGTVEYLVVGGGGSGGASMGGGGGAGGFRTGTGFAVTAQAYTITVGNGGAGHAQDTDGNNGQDSVFSTITSTGGGKGSGGVVGGAGFAAGIGGSGGGGNDYFLFEPDHQNPGTGTAGQGYDGGTAIQDSDPGAGGGGGAGAVGGNNTVPQGSGGAGGAGVASSITGSSVTYGGGGGGAAYTGSAGAGGAGGGGAGNLAGGAGTAGTANTGGGGGGGLGYTAGAGGAGGSGIVIIRYPTPNFWTQGKFGSGGDFEFGNSEYQYAADNATLSITGSTTLAGWIKPESVTAATLFDIVGKWDGANESYLMAQYGDEIRCYIDSSSNYATTDAANLATGTWYHASCAYDATTATVKLYINGEISASTVTSTIPSSVGDDAGRFHVGAEDSTTTAANFYDGVIDEARVYNRALSPAEIQQLYNFAPGPVAYYKFEEGQGNNANDTSGNANNGTWNGTVPYWTQGNYGKGGNFNGSNNYVSITPVSPTSLTGSYTVSAWVKPNTTSGTIDVFGTRGSGNNSFDFKLQSGNTIHGDIGNGTGWLSTTADATYNYSVGKWYYITYAVTGTGYTIYVNGISVGSGSYAADTPLLFNSTHNIYIGYYGGCCGAEGTFNGTIDEVKVYNYARTAGQIVEDLNAGHPAPGSPVGSPISYWKLDQGYGTAANNSISGQPNFSLTASPNDPAWTQAGKLGKALDFDGAASVTSEDYADATFTATTWDQGTLSLWIRPNSLPGSEYYPISNYNGVVGEAGGWLVGIESDGSCSIRGNAVYADACPASSFAANTWTHLVFVVDKTNAIRKIYINGVLKMTATGNTYGFRINATLRMGMGSWCTTASDCIYPGLLDEVKVYNSALTSDQVKLDYNRGQSLVLGATSDTSGLTGGSVASNSASAEYCIPGDTTSCSAPTAEWRFEEGSGTSANDSSGSGDTGTIAGATYVAGKFGKALNFDGTNDSVSETSLATSISGNATLELWFNVSSAPGAQVRLADLAQAATLGLQPSMNTSGNILFDNSGGPGASVTTTGTYHNGKWHHAVVTRSSNTYALYVDGVLIGSDATGTAPTYTRLFVGERSDGTSDFTGKIDHVRVFNYVRTAAQIAWDYNQGKPVGHWKFDECQGATAGDSSGNGNSGTITIGASGTQTSVGTCSTSGTSRYNGVSGKYNYSLNFDGTDDYVDVGDAYDNSAVMSWGAWFKANAFGSTGILGKRIGSSEYMQYTISANAGSLYCLQSSSGAAWQTLVNTSVPSTSAWHHVICTNDGTNARMYLNGVEVGTVDSSPATSLAASTETLKIGYARVASADRYFNGQIDDARIYNYALTKQQVKNVMNQDGAIRYGPATGAP